MVRWFSWGSGCQGPWVRSGFVVCFFAALELFEVFRALGPGLGQDVRVLGSDLGWGLSVFAALEVFDVFQGCGARSGLGGWGL